MSTARSPLAWLAHAAALVAAACVLSACSAPAERVSPSVPVQPEAASGYAPKPGWATQRTAVAAANPLATEAGLQVLRAGGSAVDAAVAVQMVLTLVEPQSSGIGGGGFLMHHDGRRVQAFDGRETAPAAADEKLFLAPDQRPMPFMQAVVGGRSVGVPGLVRMLEMAHRQHGRLPWARLFEPAIDLAQNGFPISSRLHTLLAADPALRSDPQAAALYYRADGSPLPVGHRLKNPALADALRQLATGGSAALHEGPLAQAIVDKVRGHAGNPGRMTLADLAGYQALERHPLCHGLTAQGRPLQVCGFPPPSSGALAIGQILGMLAHTPAAQAPLVDGLPGTDWLHAYAEVSRLAFADRAQYVADPAFVSAPAGDWSSLLSPDYLARRAALVGFERQRTAAPGQPGPEQAHKAAYAPMPEQPEYGTTHISIVDAHGNALAMTSSIEAAFGARLMVSGFLLNNQLTDFSFAPTGADGRAVANRVQPGKRPRSSMSPTLVLDPADGGLLMAAGSPGGAAIIHYTAKLLHGVLQWGLLPQQAIDLPNFATLGGPVLLEAGRFPAETTRALRAKGHELREVDLTSGLQAIARGQVHGRRLWLGGADPRREGVVMGD